MNHDTDIIIAGSGHNALITAGYLAKAGKKVLVLEKNKQAGGGVITQELTAPGFKHDRHSTAHVFIQANPLILNDELELKSKFGLEYIYPEVMFATIYDDHRSLITYQSVEKTCESIAQFSKKDADTYRVFVKRCQTILPMLVAGMFVPPAPLGTFIALLDQSSEGREIFASLQKSVFDIVNEWFEDDRIKIHLLKFTSEALAAPEEKGTGLNLFLMAGFVHKYYPGLPVGGSGALSESLIRCIQHYGGEIRTSSEVTRVITEQGKAIGVRLDNGEEILSNDSVVGTFHPELLENLVDDLPNTVIDEINKLQPSSFSCMNTHYAINKPLEFHAGGEAHKALLLELVPSNLETFRRTFDSYKYNEIPQHHAMVAAMHSNHDASRAPEDCTSLYLYAFMPFNINQQSAEHWDDLKTEVADQLLKEFKHYASNFTDDSILARHVDSPMDMLRHSSSYQHGDIHGTGPFIYQFGGHRPTPSLSNYRVPGVENLFLVGPFMHPGGGVFGGGRATAVRVFEDLNIDWNYQ
ncbi:MAG: NAD(P)/FAD-dependent oxidoreductase [Proteobacteria bacterium]|nr:NAD(P)/FAD-dependent oxidoreductase [Pseudomonadota bacterium]NOG59554.1 NAD(P)/FAD-dependent oxidoreductase [Pseudomonadota bacterium]